MEDFAVTCPLVPNVPHLRSGSCTSPRAFGLGFLQTPPHDDALALLLAFGSSYTWRRDLHPTSSVPCLAHTYLEHLRVGSLCIRRETLLGNSFENWHGRSARMGELTPSTMLPGRPLHLNETGSEFTT